MKLGILTEYIKLNSAYSPKFWDETKRTWRQLQRDSMAEWNEQFSILVEYVYWNLTYLLAEYELYVEWNLAYLQAIGFEIWHTCRVRGIT